MKRQRKFSFFNVQGKKFIEAKEKEFAIYKDSLKIFRKIVKPGRNEKQKRKKKIKILDLGCGYGRFIKRIKDIGSVFGIDTSRKALKFTKKLGVPILVGDGEKIPIKSRKLDAVLCIEVLSHTDKPQNMLKEIKRILKKSGILFLSVENLYGGIISDPYIKKSEIKRVIEKGERKEVKYFRKEEIISMLEKMGFRIIYFRPVGFARAGPLEKYNFRNVEKIERTCAKYIPLLARAFTIIAKNKP